MVGFNIPTPTSWARQKTLLVDEFHRWLKAFASPGPEFKGLSPNRDADLEGLSRDALPIFFNSPWFY